MTYSYYTNFEYNLLTRNNELRIPDPNYEVTMCECNLSVINPNYDLLRCNYELRQSQLRHTQPNN